MPQDLDFITVHRHRVTLSGVAFDPVREEDVIQRVLAALDAGQGGQIITPNVDILRRAYHEEECRNHIASSSLVVADGAPLIWASRIAGDPLPARVPGSDLIWSLSTALGDHGRSVYLLGGEPGTARLAAAVLRERFPGLTVAGELSPPFGFDTSEEQLAQICAEVTAARPDLVFVGLGFPKQERLIARLRPLLPRTWFMGCGAAIGFVAGVHQRAPRWMQRTGLEWVHRLLGEPQRLVRRYLIHDVPFALRLLAGSVRDRLRRRAHARTAPAPAVPPVRRIPAPRTAPPAHHRDPVGTGKRS
ncbi:WecB/TagA/CpsF family glycosyltransferase [Solwaraspora sp. WMMD406]|uniref:WecB/TagA/CpsF family glycosyltransferase n=1 Tax=Solwaraspora sp. WMMD406 TaxID=3016095 RepID=UPI002416600C|nr:WecB/TagA/CpsF family glycosyltransferase [Solwaraspora sp. WMMD406]MDG4764263.1 WecB/TagA/CpsF family glycosyltransferase [Solwaraspora sp. WMMD406]